jgi:type II secretory ATPase GspE/PulE/Tfp pilus assembly ATPase PilB-like protein
MAMSPRIRDLTLDRASAGEIKKAAIAEGMLSLRRDGLQKLKRGLTTAQEILKESASDEL